MKRLRRLYDTIRIAWRVWVLCGLADKVSVHNERGEADRSDDAAKEVDAALYDEILEQVGLDVLRRSKVGE